MAARPWVTPQEVREYTEIAAIQSRSDQKLALDIARAEYRVIDYCNNCFDDEELYPTLPESVKLAVLLLAEVYAHNAARMSTAALTSESFDDYSYTASAGTLFGLNEVDLAGLLTDYVVRSPAQTLTMRLRRL